MGTEPVTTADRRVARAFCLRFRQRTDIIVAQLPEIDAAETNGYLDRARLFFKTPLWKDLPAHHTLPPVPWDAGFVNGVPIRSTNDPEEVKKIQRERDAWLMSRSSKSYSDRRNREKSKERFTLYESIRERPTGPLSKLSENELLWRLTTGPDDDEAVSEFYHRLFPWVYKYLLGTGSARGAEEAEEITQTTLIESLRDIKSFKRKSGLFTWVYSIADNNARDYYRPRDTKRKRKLDALFTDTVEYAEDSGPVLLAGYEDGMSALHDGLQAFSEDDDAHAAQNDDGSRPVMPGHAGPDPLTRLLGREQKDRVHEHIAELPFDQILVVYHRLMKGVVIADKFRWKAAAADVAKTLDMPSSAAVKQTQYRALTELRLNVGADWYFKERRVKNPGEKRRQLRHLDVVRRMWARRFSRYQQILRGIVFEFAFGLATPENGPDRSVTFSEFYTPTLMKGVGSPPPDLTQQSPQSDPT